MGRRSLSAVVIAVCVVVVAALASIAYAWLQDEGPELGLPADDFVAYDILGRQVSLADNSGKATVLHFTQL